MTTATTLTETTTMVGTRVDRIAGIIRGVKILGRTSRNGRSYLPETLRSAAGLYEGKQVNVDHLRNPTERRSYGDRIGRLQNVTVREDGLFGDLYYNPKHAMADQLAWDAEHAPGNVGLSHDAVGRTTRRDGIETVEAIESVRSVDLVADPASTSGLFESIDNDHAETERKRIEAERRLATPAAERWTGQSAIEEKQLAESVSRWRDNGQAIGGAIG